jgi:hypothetical protein
MKASIETYKEYKNNILVTTNNYTIVHINIYEIKKYINNKKKLT